VEEELEVEEEEEEEEEEEDYGQNRQCGREARRANGPGLATKRRDLWDNPCESPMAAEPSRWRKEREWKCGVYRSGGHDSCPYLHCLRL
jgi:hypothetical protein